MYYAMIGLLGALIMFIENQDILFGRKGAFSLPAWEVYRKFLISVFIYYIVDILWGFLEERKLAGALFVDTSVYFIVMAVGILFWTQYVVVYLDEDNGFGKYLVYAGRGIAAFVAILSVVNIFTPVLFKVDSKCVYYPLETRYFILGVQILLLLSISLHAIISMLRNKAGDVQGRKYRTIALFGLIMAVFLSAQSVFPYLPLYAIAFLLGTCLLRALVIGDEKEAYREQVEEAEKISELKQSISALLDNMPAVTFSKDAETGVYLACNQAFAEYAHKDKPEGVVGLTDKEIFDPMTASHFFEDDRMALSMEEPYVFYEEVLDAVGKERQFQTTKLKFKDSSGRLCLLGMGQDVTDMVRIQRENVTTKEAYEKAKDAGLIFTHIARTLARGYEDLYYVNLDTEEYIEYCSDTDSGMLNEVRRGMHFFDSCQKEADIYIHEEDREVFRRAMSRETLLESLSKNNTFFMTYRLVSEKGTGYVSMKAYRMQDDDRFIVLGITDVDDDMRQRRAAEKAKEEYTAYTRINALAGDFLCVYVVNPENDNYHLFSATSGFKSFELENRGTDFFNVSIERSKSMIYSEDLDRFLEIFSKESIMTETENSGIFVISYRMMINGRPNYVRMKAALVDEPEGKRLIIGIIDIDSHVRQEEVYLRRLAQAQEKANIDELTGVKSRHAYLDEERRLDRLILENHEPAFAVVLLDVNDLKKVNDTLGHQEGDRYLKEACRIICNIFKRSPVYRVGGDEFAVIVQGEDYSNIDELVERLNEHNLRAGKEGGIVIACGMSKFRSDNDCVARVFENADQNMYIDKARLKEEKAG